MVNHWSSDVKLEPLSGVELELTLDTSAARQALHDLHFIELKGILNCPMVVMKLPY